MKEKNEFIGNKCVFILRFQSEIWNDVAMKLLFSRINEERKCFNFITTSGCLARKREWVHFGPNPWDWDRNEICGQIFSGSRTGHTCSVRLVDFEGEGLGEK